MSDERIRELERVYKEEGTLDSELEYLMARQRFGEEKETLLPAYEGAYQRDPTQLQSRLYIQDNFKGGALSDVSEEMVFPLYHACKLCGEYEVNSRIDTKGSWSPRIYVDFDEQNETPDSFREKVTQFMSDLEQRTGKVQEYLGKEFEISTHIVDLGRVDYRIVKDNQVYLISIGPIPTVEEVEFDFRRILDQISNECINHHLEDNIIRPQENAYFITQFIEDKVFEYDVPEFNNLINNFKKDFHFLRFTNTYFSESILKQILQNHENYKIIFPSFDKIDFEKIASSRQGLTNNNQFALQELLRVPGIQRIIDELNDDQRSQLIERMIQYQNGEN